MKAFLLIFSLCLGLALLPGHAQNAPTGPVTSVQTSNSGTDAINVAKDGVDPSLRQQIVSVYGVGTPAAIQTWWVIFYDPATASHGRAVKVENGRIVSTYEAKGGVVYGDTLLITPAQITGEGPALAAAQDYAGQHALAYDRVRLLLRVTTKDQALRWRVQLFDGTKNRGFVFVNTSDGSLAMYAPPDAVPTNSSSGTGGVSADVHHAANDVKDTFLGIGGDLQEFFTGERTVDH
jgi:hypothetical protein